jgi:hypothetical protein
MVNNKFIFSPTYMVTGQIFNKILNNKPMLNTVYYGHYGISKSVSIMLLCMLSNIIV